VAVLDGADIVYALDGADIVYAPGSRHTGSRRRPSRWARGSRRRPPRWGARCRPICLATTAMPSWPSSRWSHHPHTITERELLRAELGMVQGEAERASTRPTVRAPVRGARPRMAKSEPKITQTWPGGGLLGLATPIRALCRAAKAVQHCFGPVGAEGFLEKHAVNSGSVSAVTRPGFDAPCHLTYCSGCQPDGPTDTQTGNGPGGRAGAGSHL
jgi:hypothetical protein